MKYSEEWFLKAFQQLKKACGHALIDIDFKEFTEILECIRDKQQLDELLSIINANGDILNQKEDMVFG
jgi:hypothetical protein